MKHLMLVLALVLGVSLGLAQGYIYVNPTISTTTVTLCTTYVSTARATFVKHASTGFAAIFAGQKVFGVGVPYGTTVAYSDSADSLVLSAAVTQGGIKSLQFGVFEGTDYSIGDWVGQPFRVYTYPGNGECRLLVSVEAVDNADMMDSIDVVLFNAFSDTLGLDNAASAIVASQAYKVIGTISLTGVKDLGTARVLQSTNLGWIVPKENLYGRMIARGALAPLTVGNIRLRFGFW